MKITITPVGCLRHISTGGYRAGCSACVASNRGAWTIESDGANVSVKRKD